MSAHQDRLAELETELSDRGTDKPPTPAQRRRRDGSEALDALDLPDVDERGAPRLPSAGEQVHFLETGRSIPQALPGEFTGPGSHITTRGETITLTDRLLRAAVNAAGAPGWVAYVHDAEAQIARYGRVWVASGPAPADLAPWIHGDPEWSVARERARREAHARPTAQERAEALAEVHRIYGDAPTTSTTLNAAPHPTIAAADAQAARIAASGVKHVSHCEAREAGTRR